MEIKPDSPPPPYPIKATTANTTQLTRRFECSQEIVNISFKNSPLSNSSQMKTWKETGDNTESISDDHRDNWTADDGENHLHETRYNSRERDFEQ